MASLLLCLCVLLIFGTSFANNTTEQQLCKIMIDKFNTFVDMVPMILSITFPAKNDYFVGSSEVILYPVENSTSSPQCSLVKDENHKLFKVEVIMPLAILNQGRRMFITQCMFAAHIRLQKNEKYLFVDPQLIDVDVPGNVTIDGHLLEKEKVDEDLRPTLVKGFTILASQRFSYSGLRSGAIYIDPEVAATLFKQLMVSYVSQLV